MDFSTKKFRDCFTEINTGIPPGFYDATTTIGSPISMIGVRKLVFHIFGGSASAGACSTRLLLYAASASTGTGSTVLGGSGSQLTSPLIASIVSASGGAAMVEIRGEYVEGQSKGPWIIPVMSTSGDSVTAAVFCMGYLRDYQPATFYDTSSFLKSETLLL